MRKEIYILIILISLFAIGLYLGLDKVELSGVEKKNITESNKQGVIQEEKEFGYSLGGLNTNTAKKSIDLEFILDGGPGKDGIPAINQPEFFIAGEEKNQEGLSDEVLGIALNINNESKFYPYTILYWHEIVNDIVGGQEVSVTFCPLCGSAIVFDRNVNGNLVDFGVSGKLYESNLLMYDSLNHSLWSQSTGEAVVGDDIGRVLKIIKSDVMTYAQYKNNYNNGLVLSEETGYQRSYDKTPYGSYESDNDLYFPILYSDERLHKKELLYVMPYNGESYSFVREELKKVGKLTFTIEKQKIDIVYDDGIITSRIGEDIIPGYIEMFFSWATQHPENDNLWIGE